ncbi:hypothetical protein [Paenibacillus darwinianus]|uniref:hypothetical protein n=1 Tax=Paenibacillus darwinianus TaxID=1380763 RepID=UPI000B30CA02|nr:hypothetical protein [Paenibacillus darwinianus]
MIPYLLFQIALIIIVVRCVYVLVQMSNAPKKRWLDVLFHGSVGIVCLYFLL